MTVVCCPLSVDKKKSRKALFLLHHTWHATHLWVHCWHWFFFFMV